MQAQDSGSMLFSFCFDSGVEHWSPPRSSGIDEGIRPVSDVQESADYCKPRIIYSMFLIACLTRNHSGDQARLSVLITSV